MIQVNDLTKIYDDLVAVDHVSFDVHRGEIFSLVGPNGAGKTTTVEILECLRNPTEGQAEIFGYDVVGESEEVKERIGVMPQEFNTFDRLTVRENVELVGGIYGRSENLDEVYEDLGLSEESDKNFEELSGGMKRRVGIAMALAGNPDVLFLDEPTTGLDPRARRELWDTIKGLKDLGVTIVLTTHYMEEVEELSDRAGIILDGNLLSVDSVEDLISEYGEDVKIVVRDSGEARNILERYTKDVFSEETGEFVGRFESMRHAAEAHFQLYKELSGQLDVELVGPSMEDVFLNVAGGRIDESGKLIE
ncbi:MAG: ABC transporter ATP-binding protein [Candidatus Hadarchaeota archaeon]